MRLSNQLHPNAFDPPRGFQSARTSDLIIDGMVATLPHRGLPAYSVLGQALLDRVERRLVEAAATEGADRVSMPILMRDEELVGGQDVGDQFASKFIRTTGGLNGFHLMSTPEMMFLSWLRGDDISYRALPKRVAFVTPFFRDVPRTKSILTCREFRIFGVLSLESDADRAQAVVAGASEMTNAVAAEFGVPTVTIGQGASKLETAYPCGEGDITFNDTAGARHKALSLSVGYEYEVPGQFPVRFRAANNKRRDAHLATFGFCTNRLVYALLHAARDELGFNLPESARILDVALIPGDRNDLETIEPLYRQLQAAGARVMLDDRTNRPIAQRQQAADYIGVAKTLAIGAGKILLRMRGLEEAERVASVPDAFAALSSQTIDLAAAERLERRFERLDANPEGAPYGKP